VGGYNVLRGPAVVRREARVQFIERACCLPKGGEGRIVRIATVWSIVLELVSGNDVIFEVDALTYVVLSEAEKHVSYGGN
jgi:hypothetical protein